MTQTPERIERLRKCKVMGCKRMARRFIDYGYCKEHRVWMAKWRRP